MINLDKPWVCPACKGQLMINKQQLSCTDCSRHYRVENSIPILMDEKRLTKNELSQKNIYENYKGNWIEPVLQYNNHITLSSANIYSAFRALNLKKDQNVLEIGCFNSNKLMTLSMLYGINAYGIDLSHPAILEQAKLIKKYKIKSEYVVANASFLPCRKAFFDAILLLDILEHVENKQKLMLQCYDTLKPGGRIFLKVPTEKDASLLNLSAQFKAKWIIERRKNIGHLQDLALSKKELKKLIKDAKFKIIKWKVKSILLDTIWEFIISIIAHLYLRLKCKNKHNAEQSARAHKLKRNKLCQFIVFLSKIITAPDLLVSVFNTGGIVYVIAEKLPDPDSVLSVS